MPVKRRVGIMQPYFLPYLGYWQLMNCVDMFVVYDDVQFTKKGWMHRNRYLNNDTDLMFSLPLKKDSDFLDVGQRNLADSWIMEKSKLIRKIDGAYKKAPFYDEGIQVLNKCLECESNNLFDFIFNSIKVIKKFLKIDVELLISSEIGSTKHLKGQDRVLEICKALEATEYINPIGGYELYKKSSFNSKGIGLKFHQIGNVQYDQMHEKFLSNLSVLDAIMFIGVNGVINELENFELK